MEEKRCKNPKCKRILPNDYNKPFCENCINSGIDTMKKVGKPVLGVVAFAASLGVRTLTGGKLDIRK